MHRICYLAVALAFDAVTSPVANAQDAQARRGFAAILGSDERQLAVVDLASGPEICVGQYGYWVVLRHEPSTNAFEQVYVSPPVDASSSSFIRDLVVADVQGDSALEVILATTDDQVRIFDYATKRPVGGFPATGFLGSLRARDVLGDAKAELLAVVSGQLVVSDGAGNVHWTYGAGLVSHAEIGQLDDDPALEIAFASGVVVDASTHDAQWTGVVIQGNEIAIGDIDADGRDELVVGKHFQGVRAFDVELRAQKWLLPWTQQVKTITVADARGDARPEILVGGGIGGATLRLVDSSTLATLDTLSSTDPIADVSVVRDFDGDGAREILWSSGFGVTSSKHLRVNDAATLALEWESLNISGPFVGPALGDVDGDGASDLVCASGRGNPGARALVLDPSTLRLKAASQVVADGESSFGTYTAGARDVDGDGRAEIFVGSDKFGHAIAEVFRFTAPSTFERVFVNATLPDGAGASSIVVADLEHDGSLEVVVGLAEATTAFEGPHFYVYDWASGAEEWRDPTPPGPSVVSRVSRLFVDDVDADGVQEIVTLRDLVGIQVFDAVTRTLEQTFSGLPTALDLVQTGSTPNARRLLLAGDWSGSVIARWFDGAAWSSSTFPAIASSPIDGLALHYRRGMHLAFDGRVVRSSGLTPVWSSARYGDMGEDVVPLSADGSSFVTCSRYAVLRF